jgi:integrase
MGRPQPPGHDAIRIQDWPAPDRHALAAAERPARLLDERGRAATWRPATRHALVGAYGRWLGHLRGQGVDLAAELPTERVTPARIDTYRRFLAGRCAPVTVASYLGQLHMFLLDLWPDRDWAWLSAIQARQQRLADPSRNKAPRIVALADVVQLGLDLMEQADGEDADRATAGPSHPSLLYRDGLLIALLAMRPLRQRNLLGLRIGAHLRRSPDGWDIHIPATESKTHTAITQPVPASLLRHLERYLAHHRPRLLVMRGPMAPGHTSRPADDQLWVTRCGTAMTPGSLQKLLRRHTQARFGVVLNCHVFRDIAATAVAEARPEGRQLAADLLGHRNVVTTERHYIGARQQAALRQCQEDIVRLRRSFGPSRRRADKALAPAMGESQADSVFDGEGGGR